MSARKTVTVEAVKAAANAMLRDSIPAMTDGRVGIATLLERVLHDTGNYKGFRYIDGDHGNTDDTRRHYF
jgi:hypothetical protein